MPKMEAGEINSVIKRIKKAHSEGQEPEPEMQARIDQALERINLTEFIDHAEYLNKAKLLLGEYSPKDLRNMAKEQLEYLCGDRFDPATMVALCIKLHDSGKLETTH